MSGGLRRSLADLACRALQATLPPSLQDWGWAVRCETASIEDDTKALLFAIDSLCGLMLRAVALRLLRPLSKLVGDEGNPSWDSTILNGYRSWMRRPRLVGIACVIGAVTLGLTYMAMAGAPMRYLQMNAGALVIGLSVMALLRRITAARHQWDSRTFTAMAGVLLATALLGENIDGAARWVNLGGLSVQPSLILLPAMLVAYARTHNVLSTMGIIATAAAMAIQPDRAMAGMLAAGLAVLAVMRRDNLVTLAFGASIFGFVATLVRSDTLPAAPYVDQILYTAFHVHLAAGVAVLGGSILLLVPAIVGWCRDPAHRVIYAVFGTAWFGGILAAALGHYPTPIVGYGGSAIIGYALSLLALPKLASGHTGAATRKLVEANMTPLDRHLRVELA